MKDQSRTVVVAYSGGTLTGGFGTNGAKWDEYIESQRKIAKAAADAGATVILSNHSEYDGAYTKARLLLYRVNPARITPSSSAPTACSGTSRSWQSARWRRSYVSARSRERPRIVR